VCGSDVDGATTWSRWLGLGGQISIGVSRIALDIEPCILLGSLNEVGVALLLEWVDEDVGRDDVTQLIVFDSAD
jgi:hypothetical protein